MTLREVINIISDNTKYSFYDIVDDIVTNHLIKLDNIDFILSSDIKLSQRIFVPCTLTDLLKSIFLNSDYNYSDMLCNLKDISFVIHYLCYKNNINIQAFFGYDNYTISEIHKFVKIINKEFYIDLIDYHDTDYDIINLNDLSLEIYKRNMIKDNINLLCKH